MRALLDVNVLIALLDTDHVHHGPAASWLEVHLKHGWASCPITQNGCIRIMSQPGYPNPLPAVQVAQRLAEAAARPQHRFWPDSISLFDETAVDRSRLLSARQVTDAYLLALAVHNKGTFVTFDRSIALAVVPGAQERNVLVLS